MAGVDLRLASSYVPAIVCVFKSIGISALAVLLVPVGGVPALALMVMLDRMFVERSSVFDVNAVVAFVFGLCVVVEERHHRGTHTQLAIPLLCVWSALALLQSCRPIMSGRWEIGALSVVASLVSVTHQTEEMAPLVLGRVFCFVSIVVGAVYISACMEDEGGGSLLLFLMRAGPVMLAPAVPGFGFGYLMLMAVVGTWRWRRSIGSSAASSLEIVYVGNHSGGTSVNSVGGGGDVEATADDALLREALARHKGGRTL